MTLGGLLDQFSGKRVIVLGDVMLDEYIFGRATRISPEAPVMVVRQFRTEAVPGGAANVAKNLTALGGIAKVVGVVGEDEAGAVLGKALEASGLAGSLLIADSSKPTTRKTRVLADSAHQVLRIDHEEHRAVDSTIEGKILEAVLRELDHVDVVLISDYQKGAVTQNVVQTAVSAAKQRNIPVIANAKPSSLSWYSRATLVSLNQPEAAMALGWAELREERDKQSSSIETAVKAASQLSLDHHIEHVLVTLGGQGMCTELGWTAPHKVEVFDTAGAGDTTIASVALGLSAVGFEPIVFELAARAAACVVQKVGVAVPSHSDLSEMRATQLSS